MFLDDVHVNIPAGKARYRKKRVPMYPKTRALLDAYYRPYNKQLAALLNDERFLWETNR